MLHFSAGYMTAMPLGVWTKKFVDEDYGVVSLGFPIVMGYLKEVRDQKTLNFMKWRERKPNDPNDAYWDFTAVVLGSICGKFMTYTF
jgi:hypothetical protein